MCLSHLLPFNFIEDNNDFYAAVQELSNSTADSLRYLSEKVFQPFESDFNEYEELNDIDPDINFIMQWVKTDVATIILNPHLTTW